MLLTRRPARAHNQAAGDRRNQQPNAGNHQQASRTRPPRPCETHDCNETDASIYPGAPDLACDGLDTDCVADAAEVDDDG
ncbi:MAG TPA: hypothetical protein EYP98_07315, partial [Planctomycetes bacterium]|nr:hypothetical protein [Planctomycetota bacterium]